jgi:hypothetical protein
VEEGIEPDLIQTIGEGLEMHVGQRFVGQWSQMFGRLEFGRVDRQEHQFKATGDFQVFGDMRAWAVEHQDHVLVRASADPRPKASSRASNTAGRTREAIQVEPLVAVVPRRDRVLPRGARCSATRSC